MKNYLILFVIIISFLISCERKNKTVIEEPLKDNSVKEINSSDFELTEEEDVYRFDDRTKAHWKLRKKMYVINTKGLEERDSPSVDGQVLKTYLYCELFTVYDKSDETITIDGITDYWYKCPAYIVYDGDDMDAVGGSSLYSFVFGGHLAKQLPSNAPITILNGYWTYDPEINEGTSFEFSGNTFVLWTFFAEAEARGTFSIRGDKLILNFTREQYPHARAWREYNPIVSRTLTFSLNNKTLKTSKFSIDDYNTDYNSSEYYLFLKHE